MDDLKFDKELVQRLNFISNLNHIYSINVCSYTNNMLWGNDFCYNIFQIVIIFERGKPSYFWNLTVYSGHYIFEIQPFKVDVLACLLSIYCSFLSWPTLKEFVNEVSINVINKWSINVVIHIYHPPPPPTPTPPPPQRTQMII